MSEEKRSKLSGLYAYKLKLIERIDEKTKERTAVDTELVELNDKLSGVLRNIEHIEGRQVLITTHFIERYHQRVGPADATEDNIRGHIVTPQLLKMIDTLGNGVYPVEGMIGYSVVVQDNKLITINEPRPKEKPIYKKIKPQGRVKPRRYK